jgi:hypothetical protein
MRLEGWNHIPDGFAATFDRRSAPFWLRALVQTPFLDRYGYALLVRRGFGHLTHHPDVLPDPRVVAEARKVGWNVDSQPSNERAQSREGPHPGKPSRKRRRLD